MPIGSLSDHRLWAASVSAAAAAIQQSLLRMEKVRTPPPPFPFYNVPPDIFSLRAPSQTTPIPLPRPLTFSPRAHLPPPRSQQASAEGKPPSSPPASAIKREPRLSEHATPPPSDPGSAAKRRKMSLGGASSAGMSTGGGTAEKDKDKGGKGLRHFSMKVCEKVESKQRTTYNEVADELVAEFSKPDDPRFCADQAYDEKNKLLNQTQFQELLELQTDEEPDFMEEIVQMYVSDAEEMLSELVKIFEAAEPNAFATGASRNKALVAVSTGLLRHMNEGEVEAVELAQQSWPCQRVNTRLEQ